jgi:OFA family oxalate/formate antiporter-like MFS transporter
MLSSFKQVRPFYGWYIVAATFIIGFYVVGVVFYGFTTIFKPIVEEFGWSYAQVSLAASLRGVETGLLAPVVGMLIDRWGPRRIVFIGGCLTALGLFMLSRVDSLVTFYVSFILISAAMSSCMVSVLMTAVSKWFRRKIGLAMSIVSCGFGAGGLMVFVMARLVDAYGWRMTVQGLAFGVLFIVLPLALLLRHKPQEYGYLPDGDKIVEASAGKSTTEVKEYGITIKKAVKTRTFRLLAVMFVCQHTIVATAVTHVMPYLIDVGMDTTIASLGAAGIPLASIIGRMGFGVLGDRVNRKWLMAVVFAMISLGLLSFQMAGAYAIPGVIGFLVLFGTGYGGFNSIRPAFLRETFGTKQFGTIFGSLIGIGMFGTIAGPYIAGRLFDIQGSYNNVWLIFAAVALVAFVASIAINDKQSYYDNEFAG